MHAPVEQVADELVQGLIRAVADIIIIAAEQRDAKIAWFHDHAHSGANRACLSTLDPNEWRRAMTDLSGFPITGKWPAVNPDVIQYYGLPTPNGVKVTIMLEE